MVVLTINTKPLSQQETILSGWQACINGADKQGKICWTTPIKKAKEGYIQNTRIFFGWKAFPSAERSLIVFDTADTTGVKLLSKPKVQRALINLLLNCYNIKLGISFRLSVHLPRLFKQFFNLLAKCGTNPSLWTHAGLWTSIFSSCEACHNGTGPSHP